MGALVYALNDSDERVRREAADEIGDALRKHCCLCQPCVIAALTCALGDCDRAVVREATQALRACGYDVVDPCCDPCCTTSTCCNTGNGCTSAPAMAPAPVMTPAPVAPQPAVEPTPAPAPAQTGKVRKSLSTLLGLAG